MSQEEQNTKRGRPYRLHAALLELAALDKSDFSSALKQILKVSAQILQVDRVGLWFFRQSPLSIECQESYLLSQDAYMASPPLFERDYPAYFEALQKEEIITIYDARIDPRSRELTQNYLAPLGITSMMDIPIWTRGFLAGVLCHEHVGTRRRWTLGDQEFAFAIGQIVATALEARERKKAEEAERRSSFLARASALLSESLDIEALPARLARLLVSSLADWCVIGVAEHRRVRQLAAAHADPSKEPLLNALVWGNPPLPEATRSVARALETSGPVVIPEVTDEVLRGYTSNEEEIARIHQLGISSVLFVPIGPPGKVLGGIVLVAASPGRHYSQEELDLAQELARRATNAIANARLYYQAQEAHPYSG